MKHNIVAIFGAIIPEPFAIAIILIFLLSILNSLEHNLQKVSVVIIDLAASIQEFFENGCFDLSAFKDGVADALLEGYKADWHENSHYYTEGYDFGLTMYALYNKLDEEKDES